MHRISDSDKKSIIDLLKKKFHNINKLNIKFEKDFLSDVEKMLERYPEMQVHLEKLYALPEISKELSKRLFSEFTKFLFPTDRFLTSDESQILQELNIEMLHDLNTGLIIRFLYHASNNDRENCSYIFLNIMKSSIKLMGLFLSHEDINPLFSKNSYLKNVLIKITIPFIQSNSIHKKELSFLKNIFVSSLLPQNTVDIFERENVQIIIQLLKDNINFRKFILEHLLITGHFSNHALLMDNNYTRNMQNIIFSLNDNDLLFLTETLKHKKLPHSLMSYYFVDSWVQTISRYKPLKEVINKLHFKLPEKNFIELIVKKQAHHPHIILPAYMISKHLKPDFCVKRLAYIVYALAQIGRDLSHFTYSLNKVKEIIESKGLKINNKDFYYNFLLYLQSNLEHTQPIHTAIAAIFLLDKFTGTRCEKADLIKYYEDEKLSAILNKLCIESIKSNVFELSMPSSFLKYQGVQYIKAKALEYYIENSYLKPRLNNFKNILRGISIRVDDTPINLLDFLQKFTTIYHVAVQYCDVLQEEGTLRNIDITLVPKDKILTRNPDIVPQTIKSLKALGFSTSQLYHEPYLYQCSRDTLLTDRRGLSIRSTYNLRFYPMNLNNFIQYSGSKWGACHSLATLFFSLDENSNPLLLPHGFTYAELISVISRNTLSLKTSAIKELIDEHTDKLARIPMYKPSVQNKMLFSAKQVIQNKLDLLIGIMSKHLSSSSPDLPTPFLEKGSLSVINSLIQLTQPASMSAPMYFTIIKDRLLKKHFKSASYKRVESTLKTINAQIISLNLAKKVKHMPPLLMYSHDSKKELIAQEKDKVKHKHKP